MPPRKNSRKSRKKRSSRAEKFPYLKIASFLVFLGVIVATVFLGINFVLKNNPNFKLKYIKLDMPYEYQPKFSRLQTYIGDAIFSVDLKRFADYTPEKYPYFKSLRAVRSLPNCITIEAQPRIPLARVSQDLLLDEEAVVFPNILKQDYSGLPLVQGLSYKQSEIGRPLKTKAAEISLFILSESLSSQSKLLSDLRQIDVHNVSDASFILNNSGVEIRIGEENLEKRMFLLSSIISDVDEEISEIKYIDLRFKDPVIGYR